MIDFKNGDDSPIIHVRTWQPSLTETNHPLSEKDVFSIRNFNLQ